MFHPDFSAECRFCGTSPCVVVDGHTQGDTELCGPHFFQSILATDWELWNDQEDDDDEPQVYVHE